MTVGAVNGAGKKRSPLLPVVGLGAGAFVGGSVIGNKMNGMDVLNADQFEFSDKVLKDLAEDQKATKKKAIADARADYKTVDTKAEALVTDVIGKDGKEITVEKFLGKDIAGFEADINAKTTTLTNNLTDATTKHASAKEALGKADEAGKEALKTAEAEAKKVVDGATDALKKHTELAKLDQAKLDLAKAAKDGIIPKEAYKANVANEIKGKIASTVDDVIKDIKLKNFSLPKLAMGAAVGLVAGWVVSKIVGGKKEA